MDLDRERGTRYLLVKNMRNLLVKKILMVKEELGTRNLMATWVKTPSRMR